MEEVRMLSLRPRRSLFHKDILDWIALHLNPTTYRADRRQATYRKLGGQPNCGSSGMAQQKDIIPTDCLDIVSQLAIRLGGMSIDQKPAHPYSIME